MNNKKDNRDFMKCPIFTEGMANSDQKNGVPYPPHGKKYDKELIILDGFETNSKFNLEYLYDSRRSIRDYNNEIPMTQAQLAYLLWSMAGIQSTRGNNNPITLRPVPSGGARHPFEIYVAVQNVIGLQPFRKHW